MSERGSSNRSRRGIIATQTGLQEELWDLILEAVYAVNEEFSPAVAVVTGRESARGNVLVEMEDEDGNPRQLGIARAKGTTYARGDTVMVQKTRGGEWMAHANIVANDTVEDETAIGEEQIYDGAVTGKKIPARAITKDHIDADQIEATHLKDGEITLGHMVADVAKKIQDAVDVTKVEDVVNRAINGLDDPTKKLATERWVTQKKYATERYVDNKIAGIDIDVPKGVTMSDVTNEVKKQIEQHVSNKHKGT